MAETDNDIPGLSREYQSYYDVPRAYCTEYGTTGDGWAVSQKDNSAKTTHKKKVSN